ncbi:bromodomain-containing protein DDB_G0280777 [Musca vetustissima]|uniref:bromodomain-containing protein DDB_G0280777 n=1 Tax=Musca vetustissima TaxID=27455 RepID=UPI002AB5F0E1|nr:bromodomain-containing protein DDB_G0280777 [Musca vetustissima]
MDRFVWFVLLVVFSHLVTEFTRVTGYSRGQRHDAVMVNDSSSTQPIRVQNLLQYPGQEYGQYAPRNPSYYNNANNQYNNYGNNVNGANGSGGNGGGNNNSNNNNNFFSNMFSGLFNANANDNNNDNYGSGYPANNAYIGAGPIQEGVRTVGGIIRPIIDSIFDIPISTLRAVNNLVGRLTGSYQIKLPFQQQQQQQQQNQQQFPTQQQQVPQQQYSPSLPSLPSFPFFGMPTPTLTPSTYYGGQKSANVEPKSEIEVLKRIRQIGSNSNSGNQQQQQHQLSPASL